MLRKTLIASITAVSLAAAPVFAGGMAEPILEPEVIFEDSAGTSGGILIPLLLLLLVAVAVSGSDEAQPSDFRLKTDIALVGTTPSGLPLYRFRYIDRAGTWEGVMAQDVLAVRPDAVVTGPDGYLAVRYGMLGLAMKRVD